MLPEFADAGTLPTTPGFWHRFQSANKLGKVGPGVGGDGLAIAVERETGDEFIGDQLVIGRALEGQKDCQKASDLDGPVFVVVAAGGA